MMMTRLEKLLVNRKKKGRRNAEMVRQCLEQLETETFHEALELGCGIGTVSAFLAETYGMRVWGTDFDPDQIEAARRAYPEHDRLHFCVEDATRLSFEGESFDLVVAQNVFHHIPNWEGAVSEVARVLRTEGYVVWYDLALPNLLKKLLQPLSRRAGLYTISNVTAAFDKNGLSARTYERVSHGPLGHHKFILQKTAKEARS